MRALEIEATNLFSVSQKELKHSFAFWDELKVILTLCESMAETLVTPKKLLKILPKTTKCKFPMLLSEME